MDYGITRGVTISELLRYMQRRIKGMVILALIIAILSGSLLYIKNYVITKRDTPVQSKETEIDEARKEILDKQAKVYLEYWESGYDDNEVPAADRVEAGYQAELIRNSLSAEEKVYFDKIIGLDSEDPEKEVVSGSSGGRPISSIIVLALGFGLVTSIVVYIIKCITSPQLPSGRFFIDRYGLPFIPWNSNGVGPGNKTDAEVTDIIKAIVEGEGLREMLLTGTLFEETDLRLIGMIKTELTPLGVEVSAVKMDVLNADVIRKVKKAGMIILIEHLFESDINAIDEEIRLIKENARGIVVKAILLNGSDGVK